MRIGIGQLGAWAGPATVTLADQTIADPGNTPATAADCLPYQCGADPENAGARIWCSFWGQSGARSCVDPNCAAWRDSVPGCSLPAPAGSKPAPELPMLTPQSIVQPLPSITLQPVVVAAAEPGCNLWCDLNGAIAAHPVVAVVGLLAAVALIWPRGRGRYGR